MSTRNDVARLAGVSPAVVSYVLNNSNYVSEEKRKAVLDAVKELNYHPNLFASALKSGKSREFLLVTDDIRNNMFSEIAFYMEPYAFEYGYTITVMSSAEGKYDEMISSIQAHKYAGVFIFSGIIPFTREYTEKLNLLAENGIPIVLFRFIHNTSPLHRGITVLKADIRSAVCRAVDYLIEEKQHSVIAYLGDGDPKASGESEPYGDGLRVNGYVDSLLKHGIAPRQDLIFFCDQFEHERFKYLNTDGVVKAYFNLPSALRPTAFFVNSDELAASLMQTFKKNGVMCPRDIQIIGFGNTVLSELVSPELTTVKLPFKEIAEYTVKAISESLTGKSVESTDFLLPLILRGSA